MKIKKGDTVKILTGKDRGKKGKVIQVLPNENMVMVENINMMVKNIRPKKAGEKGQKVEYAAPLNISNVSLLCPKCSKPTRAGYKVLKNEKIRICKKCKEKI
ncbi:MAG: 50S ribosomal protein L24 [Patescibacteria group bacterium]|nr:50S ribosomal protein L24 [Patescibacteria group bacterium]